MKNLILNLFCFLSIAIFTAQEVETAAEIEVDLNAVSAAEIEEVVVPEPVVLNWAPSFKLAQKESRKQKKPILIYFTGSDWCGPCKILDKKLFHTEKFKKLADSGLILYEADNPRNKDLISSDKLVVNDNLKRKYNIRSYPTLVMVNDRGNIVGFKKGLLMTEYYYPFLQSVIENY